MDGQAEVFPRGDLSSRDAERPDRLLRPQAPTHWSGGGLRRPRRCATCPSAPASGSTSEAPDVRLWRTTTHRRRRSAARPRRASPHPPRSVARRLRVGVRRGTPYRALRLARPRAPSRRPSLRLLVPLRPGVRCRAPDRFLQPLVQIGLTIEYKPAHLEKLWSLARHAMSLERSGAESDVWRRFGRRHQIISFRHTAFPQSVGLQ